MEYNTCTWSPHLQKDIEAAESVQRSFTRRICQKANIQYSSYQDRLAKLNLESLQPRRIKNDLILLYKIINQLIDIDFSHFFNLHSLGGHNLRRHNLHITRSAPPKSLCRENFFTNRVIPYWNSLSNVIFTSPTLPFFKQKLRTLSFC